MREDKPGRIQESVERTTTMGGKPSKGTKRDKRLSGNKKGSK